MEPLQCSRTKKNKANKRGNEANNKRHQKSAKKGTLPEYCQTHNANTKK